MLAPFLTSLLEYIFNQTSSFVYRTFSRWLTSFFASLSQRWEYLVSYSMQLARQVRGTRPTRELCSRSYQSMTSKPSKRWWSRRICRLMRSQCKRWWKSPVPWSINLHKMERVPRLHRPPRKRQIIKRLMMTWMSRCASSWRCQESISKKKILQRKKRKKWSDSQLKRVRLKRLKELKWSVKSKKWAIMPLERANSTMLQHKPQLSSYSANSRKGSKKSLSWALKIWFSHRRPQLPLRFSLKQPWWCPLPSLNESRSSPTSTLNSRGRKTRKWDNSPNSRGSVRKRRRIHPNQWQLPSKRLSRLCP